MGVLKVLVTGCNGQLGNALKESSVNYSTITWNFADHSEMDIMEANTVAQQYTTHACIDACGSHTTGVSECKGTFGSSLGKPLVANLFLYPSAQVQ